MNAVCWAIQNGNWSNPATWANGIIPDNSGTDQVFSNGFTVNVDVNINVDLLSNASSFRNALTPAMTSDSTPAPFAIAYSHFRVGEPGTRMFDQSPGTYWISGVASPTWVSIDFGVNQTRIVNAYQFLNGPNAGWSLRAWQLQGSNDNVNWITVHNVSVPSFSPATWYTSGLIGNTTAYRYYRLFVTQTDFTETMAGELLLFSGNATTFIAAGGSFNFNTSGVVATVTRITNGATNLFTITANSGLITISVSSNVVTFIVGGTLFNISGNCNLIVNGTTFTAGFNGAVIFTKTGVGDLTINGNLVGGTGNANPSNSFALNVSTGNVFIVGNISTASASVNTSLHCINATGNCNIYITGNVFGNSSGNTTAFAIVFSSSGILSITGNVFAGSSSFAINSLTNFTVNGNIIAGVLAAISTANNITVTVNGDVYASALAPAINLTTGTVRLNGNMYNSLGRVAIWCPNIFIESTTPTIWRFDVGGGQTKTLYTADTFPNLPSVNDVENLFQFGPANSLTGTLVIPAASDTRKGVPVGNTVGTADLTPSDWITFLQTSTHPIAVRWRNNPTVENLINILKQYNV